VFPEFRIKAAQDRSVSCAVRSAAGKGKERDEDEREELLHDRIKTKMAGKFRNSPPGWLAKRDTQSTWEGAAITPWGSTP